MSQSDAAAGHAPQPIAQVQGERMRTLVLGALGVVYGDIGTSPLYTIQICVAQTGDVTRAGIMGILSLIVWSLFVVVTLKYIFVVMRADNRGEGGSSPSPRSHCAGCRAAAAWLRWP
jgi:KUP system potassium uptake protein